MSRKTEEIKLRVTTLEKGWWQEAAASENTSLSELLRRVMNERVTALKSEYRRADEPHAEGFTAPPQPVEFTGRVPVAPLHTQPDRVRRETSCSCGKPPWLYCGGCDV